MVLELNVNIENIIVSLFIAKLIALFNHLRKNDGHIVLPSIIKRDDEKLIKPGILLDIFLTIIPGLIGVVVFGTNNLIQNIIIAIIASDYGLRLYSSLVKNEIIELQNTILSVLKEFEKEETDDGDQGKN